VEGAVSGAQGGGVGGAECLFGVGGVGGGGVGEDGFECVFDVVRRRWDWGYLCVGVFVSRPVFQSLDIPAFLPCHGITSTPSLFNEVQILIFPLTFGPLYVLPTKLLLFLSALLLFLSSPLLPFPPTHTHIHPPPTHHQPHIIPPHLHLHHPSQNSPPPPPPPLQPIHHIFPPPPHPASILTYIYIYIFPFNERIK